MRENMNNVKGLASQYFGTEQGTTVMFPSHTQSSCDSYDPRFRWVSVSKTDNDLHVYGRNQNHQWKMFHHGTWLLDLASWHLDLGSWHLVPDIYSATVHINSFSKGGFQINSRDTYNVKFLHYNAWNAWVLCRPWYVETATPAPKDLVLVIDTSGSMEKNNRMFIAREAAKTVVNTLNPNDRVSEKTGSSSYKSRYPRAILITLRISIQSLWNAHSL